MKDLPLNKLTGLSDSEFAEVLAKNPRAYMAVKGAVAEKHLEKILTSLLINKKILAVTKCSNDFDKDFYVTLNNKKEISLECKNVEVLQPSRKAIAIDYLRFILAKGLLDYEFAKTLFPPLLVTDEVKKIKSTHDFISVVSKCTVPTIEAIYKKLPQELRESGIPRYEHSASKLGTTRVNEISDKKFLEQFIDSPLTIDFQKTRNSTSKDGDNRKQRLYKINEIDVVGACLFSRTMNWEFVFGKACHFTMSKRYNDRYSNNLIIQPEKWSADFLECLKL